MNMDWERISPLKIYYNFNTSKEIVVFMLNVMISISKPMKNHFNITHTPNGCKFA